MIDDEKRIGRRQFLIIGGALLGSLSAACEKPEPPRNVYVDAELLTRFQNLMEETEQTAQTWLRNDFLKNHPLFFGNPPAYVPERISHSNKYNLERLSRPMSEARARDITESIQTVLKPRQHGQFSMMFELQGEKYPALAGRLTDIYEPDGRISASEILIPSIFDRHLLPNYDVIKNVPELAGFVQLGDGDYTMVERADHYFEVQDAQGFPTQVKFEFLAPLADTLFNLLPEFLAAEADRPSTFSSSFNRKKVSIYQPGQFFNGERLRHRTVEMDVYEWDGRYLPAGGRSVMVKTNSVGMARLRTIEPFNTTFRWPEDT